MFTFVEISRFILRSYFTVMNRSVDVSGKELLPSGPKIIAMNHTPGCDPLYLPFVLKDTPHFLLQDGTFTIPIIGWLLRQTGQIPVHRGTEKAKEALVQACSILRGGGTIAIFPEGRDVEYGTRIPAKTGAVRMALETGVPIIPVGLFAPAQSLTPLRFHWHGSERMGAWQFAGRSYIHIGAAWSPDSHSDVHAQTEELMNRIYSLVSEAERELQCASHTLLNPATQW